MTRLPPGPAIYEINTAVWLERLGRGEGRRLTLAEVPDAEWDRLAALPVDAVWLMGVWERSPAGLAIALADPDVMGAIRATLPDVHDGVDVLGSPYCVRDYAVDERFGGGPGLASARERLAARGLGLILDYVPNHVAPDHPWVTERPECLVRGTEEDLAADPRSFVRTAAGVAANGRDPYFPAWRDVVQLNAFSPALRDAVVETLTALGGLCDGLRCDMAMLMTNTVFTRTWGERAGAPPATDYWPEVIGRVRGARPDLLFIAEVYWEMEAELIGQGFDHCYDKGLYDRLASGPAGAVREHLDAVAGHQAQLLRFIENHDEPRAAATFGPAQERAAAVAFSTLPGARLYHDGQLDGRRIRIPVQLGRGPDEPDDAELRPFYERLIRAVADAPPDGASWRPCSTSGWPDNNSHERLLAWSWTSPRGDRRLVVINDSADAAQGRVELGGDGLAGRSWSLTDALDGRRFERDGDELAEMGLYVELPGWGSHFLTYGP